MSDGFWFKPERDGVRKKPTEKIVMPPLAPRDEGVQILITGHIAAAALRFVITHYPIGRGAEMQADGALDLVIQGLQSQGLVTRDAEGRWIPTAKGIWKHAADAR